MKLAALMLVGAVSATVDFNDLLALPEWKVDAACEKALDKEGEQLEDAIDAMPKDDAHKMVKKTLYRYFKKMKSICKETQVGFECEEGHEDSMWAVYNDFVYAVRNAKSPQSAKVYAEVVDLSWTLEHCAKLVTHPQALIKFQVDPEGQQKIASEWEDVVVEYRKFATSKYAHKISEDMEAWSQSPEFKKYVKVNNDFAESKEGKKMSEEIEEAMQAIANSTHAIPNGIEISNRGLDSIVDELADVDAEYFKMWYNGWGEALDNAWEDAAKNEHFHDAVKEIVDWAQTDQAEDFADELEDLDEAIDNNLKISDRPGQ